MQTSGGPAGSPASIGGLRLEDILGDIRPPMPGLGDHLFASMMGGSPLHHASRGQGDMDEPTALACDVNDAIQGSREAVDRVFHAGTSHSFPNQGDFQTAQEAVTHHALMLIESMDALQRATDGLKRAAQAQAVDAGIETYKSSHSRGVQTIQYKTAGDMVEGRQCLICHEPKANFAFKRTSECTCEGRPCGCGLVLCEECLWHHLWTSTEAGLKSFSKCPKCRSEVCTRDLQRAVARASPTGPPTKKSPSKGEEGGGAAGRRKRTRPNSTQ